jgi:hypothetical protein
VARISHEWMDNEAPRGCAWSAAEAHDRGTIRFGSNASGRAEMPGHFRAWIPRRNHLQTVFLKTGEIASAGGLDAPGVSRGNNHAPGFARL